MLPRRFLSMQKVLGALLALTSLFPLPSLLLALVLGEDTIAAFAKTSLLTAGLGAVLWWPVRRVRYELRLRDGFFIATGSWVLACLVATLPFAFGLPQVPLVHALFEAVSGLTTTGSTVLSNLDKLPMSINLWRHQLVWIGGMGRAPCGGAPGAARACAADQVRSCCENDKYARKGKSPTRR